MFMGGAGVLVIEFYDIAKIARNNEPMKYVVVELRVASIPFSSLSFLYS